MQNEKVSQVKEADNPLYSESKKSENFFNEKHGKITNQSHGNRSHASIHIILKFLILLMPNYN